MLDEQLGAYRTAPVEDTVSWAGKGVEMTAGMEGMAEERIVVGDGGGGDVGTSRKRRLSLSASVQGEDVRKRSREMTMDRMVWLSHRLPS